MREREIERETEERERCSHAFSLYSVLETGAWMGELRCKLLACAQQVAGSGVEQTPADPPRRLTTDVPNFDDDTVRVKETSMISR